MKKSSTASPARLLLALCLGLAGAVSASAGTIIGHVNDVNTGASVTGAVITNNASGHTVYADREGQFRMEEVAAGSANLTISAVGYPDQTQSVQVSVDVAMGEKVVKLDKLVVEGYREGWAKALQQKRNATNFKDVLSADAAGKLPDNNVGEALARLPGVSLDVDYGEGHFVSVRGTDPNLNTVTMDGATLATPAELGRNGRSTPMDFLGTGLINQVEVIKSPTPDMDGTSLGGTINVLTPSGFDHKGQFISGALQYGENQAAKKPIYAGDLTYTNIIPTAGGKLGVALSFNYENRQTRRDMYMGQWLGTLAAPVMYEPRLDYNIDQRIKRGGALNLDYRLDDGTRIYFKAFFNKYSERSDKNEQLYTGGGAVTPLSPTKASQATVRYDIRMISFNREAEMTNLIFGGSKVLGDYKISAEATYSDAPDKQPVYRNLSFRSGNVAIPGGYIIDYSTPYPTYDLTSILTTANPNVRQVRGDAINNQEKTSTVRADVQRDFKDWLGGKDGFMKVGVKYSDRNRNNVRDVNIYTASGYKLSDFNTPPGPAPLWVMDGRYNLPISVNPDVSRATFDSLLAQGKLVRNDSASLSNGGEDTYKVIEKITAVYGMASVNLSRDLTLLGGARYESTKAPLTAPSFYTDPVTGAPTQVVKTVTFNYGEFLPNLQLRYTVNPSTVVRAGITKTFGRPAYGDQVPKSTLDNVGGVLTTGNPQLKSYESLNYDLSVEHYFKAGGIVSLAAFYKDIANPIYTYSYTQQNVTYAGYFFPTFTVSSKQNGQSAKVGGVELSAQIPFSALVSGFADGFGVDANVSLLDSSVKVFTRPGEKLRLFASPKQIFNLGLFYEKYGVSARVAYNYKGDSLSTIGADAFSDVYNSSRYFIDAQLGYKITANLSAFLNWQNITDQTSDSYTAGSKERLSQSYWFGSNVRLGMRFTF